MKKIAIFISLINTSFILLPASSTQGTISGIKSTISKKISYHFIQPVRDYIQANPTLRHIKNFYIDPKYEKIHGIIYGFKSPAYQEEYYNPALRWMQNYWEHNISDFFIHQHINIINPIIKKLHSSDQAKHAEKIHNYYKAYTQYRTATNTQQKLTAQSNLLEKIKDLQNALDQSAESKLHTR